MIKFQWSHHPIGFPINPDKFESMSADRTPPSCSLSITFTYEDLKLRQGVLKQKKYVDLSKEEKNEMRYLLIEWLKKKLGFLDIPDVP